MYVSLIESQAKPARSLTEKAGAFAPASKIFIKQ